MTMKYTGAKKNPEAINFYSPFDRLDGTHPWMEQMQEGHVAYKVRELGVGKVAYFNYALAKEMGLISSDHPQEMNSELEQKLIQTFSLQIINEYDQLSQRRIDPTTIKPHPYMATRYLQLQHSNKQGKTSGDGRGIWNGIVKNKGLTWDVSSRGTGVTCLAPGAVAANKPLKTGGTEFGYGCGLAEIDELLAASILAEVMYLQGLKTERVLCVIDLGKGYGIGVRAAQNLLRPAHLFLYLKQEEHASLVKATDYLIQRQVENGLWQIDLKSNSRFDQMLSHIASSFGEFTAQLDIDYIFAWLDWDGDNVLADAGIIDYGSVRQFGLRHDKYRYDDVERFSTNLNEQKQKARLIVQVFAQLVEFAKTGHKKPIKSFTRHPAVKKFNSEFNRHRDQRILYRMGFSAIQRQLILEKKNLFKKFDSEFSYFERAKVSGKIEKVADGVNHPALFNVRSILREYPKFLLQASTTLAETNMTEEAFFKTILSGFAKNRDAKMGIKHKEHIRKFQNLYKMLVQTACGPNQKSETVLKGVIERAEKLNSEKRITGNALIEMVDEILTAKKKGLKVDQLQSIIDRLVFENSGMPEVKSGKYYLKEQKLPAVRMDLYAKLISLVEENAESI